MNANGAARIAFGQYKARRVGFHRANQSPPRKHEALVQVENVTVHRDKNKDGKRTGDPTSKGLFGLNQHHGHDAPAGNIGTHGAGCLVGRSKAEHQAFMALVKKDPRFASASRGYVFMTTVLNGDHFGAST